MLLNNKSKVVAYGGLLTALSVIFIYLSSILAYNKMAMLFLAALITTISVILIGPKNSLYVYISSSILSLLLVGLEGNTLTYIVFFGPYAIVKNCIEKINNKFVEIVLKLLYFNFAIFVSYKLYGLFISTPINTNAQIYIKRLLLFIQPMFLLADYVLTLLIHKFKRYKF